MPLKNYLKKNSNKNLNSGFPIPFSQKLMQKTKPLENI